MIDSDNKPPPPHFDFQGQATIGVTAVLTALVEELVISKSVDRDRLITSLRAAKEYVSRHGVFAAQLVDASIKAAEIPGKGDSNG